jgi:alkanesulfonate monooxygenase SsuD/methylene tetrahydromethanopterin reductase-like flavin-dependent oxidoreductase (luciferase family)
MAMNVRLGVSFDGFITTDEAIALAQRAVAAGARSLWVAEHLGYREAIATCMAFALKAPGAMLVPTAVSPYLWHPTPTAMAWRPSLKSPPGARRLP